MYRNQIINDAAKDRKVFYVSGKTPADTREEIRALTETEKDAILVCSYGTFSTGINIVNLHNIIFASPSKSQIRVLQSIGRGLRLHENKSKLVIFDIYDNLKYSTNHADERKQIYNDEQIPYKEIEIDL